MIELNTINDIREYKVEVICNNTVYMKKSVSHLSKLYYLIFEKDYLKKENT